MTSYKVKAGDTLGAIASRAGVTVNDLVKLNHLADPDYIRVGQVLKIGVYSPVNNPSHDYEEDHVQEKKNLPVLLEAAMEAIDKLPEVKALMEAIE